MTAYLTLKHYPLSGAQDGFTITVTEDPAQAEAQGQSVVAVRAGEQLTERQLLEALLISSANNIARMLATGVAGSDALCRRDERSGPCARDGHTIYTDPSGFDPSTVSTAADQLRVFERAMRFPVFRQIAAPGRASAQVMSTHSLPTGEHMNRQRRPLAALALIAMVALISACGSSAPAGTGTGSGGGGSGSGSGSGNNAPAGTGSSGNTTVSKREKGVKFAECMRENGVSDFPDPNAAGEFVYGASVTPAVFNKAVGACKALQPPGTLSAARSPAQQTEGLKFAQCMRENGVNDFPDPVNGQPLVDTYRIPSSATSSGMSMLNVAMQKCRDLLAKAAKGQ